MIEQASLDGTRWIVHSVGPSSEDNKAIPLAIDGKGNPHLAYYNAGSWVINLFVN